MAMFLHKSRDHSGNLPLALLSCDCGCGLSQRACSGGGWVGVVVPLQSPLEPLRGKGSGGMPLQEDKRSYPFSPPYSNLRRLSPFPGPLPPVGEGGLNGYKRSPNCSPAIAPNCLPAIAPNCLPAMVRRLAMNLAFAVFVIVTTLVGSGTAFAYQPHAEILGAVEEFILAEARNAHDPLFAVSIRTRDLDPRLRLRRCEEGLEAFLAPSSRLAGNTTVGVRCHGPVRWSLYIPIEIVVRGEVVVLAQGLPRGTVLNEQHLRMEERDLGSLTTGYLLQISDAERAVLRRAVQAGGVLTPQMLEPARLVQRGQTVLVMAQGQGVAVRIEGEALSHGALGERIRVRNLRSQQVIEGVVMADGTVSVSM